MEKLGQEYRRRASPVQCHTPSSFRDRGMNLLTTTFLTSAQLALMHALLRFSHIAAESTFTTAELHPQTAEALGCSTADYPLSALRYDLSKLRAKGLVEKIPHSRRYRLLPNGYRICLVFLKLFERIYAPLTAGLLRPFPADHKLQQQRLSQLDRLYQRVLHALNDLVAAVGLKAA